MNGNSNVLPFSRSADYLRSRAVKNRQDRKSLDALELMRKAVEKSPDTPKFWVDLAEMYLEFGGMRPTEVLLMDYYARFGMNPGCLYIAGLIKCAKRDLDAGTTLMNEYIYRIGGNVPDADRRSWEQATQTVNAIGVYEMFMSDLRPRDHYYVRLFQRLFDMFEKSDDEGIVRIYDLESVSILSYQPEMIYLFADSLNRLGRSKEAVGLIRQQNETDNEKLEVMSRALSAIVLLQNGHRREALKYLNGIKSCELLWPGDYRLAAMAFCEAGKYKEAVRILNNGLDVYPGNPVLLHLSAWAYFKNGMPQEQVAKIWKRILHTDPDDSVAAFYMDAAQQGRLAEYENLNYCLPDPEVRRRIAEVWSMKSMDPREAYRRWKTDRYFRNLLEWGMTRDEGTSNICRNLLTAIPENDAAAVNCIRRLLFDADLASENYTALANAVAGRKTNYLPFAVWSAETDDLRERWNPAKMDIHKRRVLKIAEDLIRSINNDWEMWGLLSRYWDVYRKNLRGEPQCMRQVYEAAAALAFYVLHQWNSDITLMKLCEKVDANVWIANRYYRQLFRILGETGRGCCIPVKPMEGKNGNH